MSNFLKYLPKNHLSFLIGKFAHIPLPSPFSDLLINWFVKRYGINTQEVACPISHYRSIGAFFVRDLKKDARKIEGGVVSPVDGTLRNFGKVPIDGNLPQVKEKVYSLTEFLGSDKEGKIFSKGSFFNFYLSPKDYHHVHSPFDCEVYKITHIPGKLWPVNDWSLNTINNLFSVNERVVLSLRTEYGEASVVFIGATNVGSISLTFSDIKTNQFFLGKRSVREFNCSKLIKKGERLGTFHLGSSIVVLMDKEITTVCKNEEVKFGQQIAV